MKADNQSLEELLRNPPKPGVPETLLPALRADLQSHYASARARGAERVAKNQVALLVTLRRLIRPVRWNFAGLAFCWSVILVFRWTTPHSWEGTETAGSVLVTKEMWMVMAAERRALLATSDLVHPDRVEPKASPGMPKEASSTNAPGA